jgi:asparagine synthase (glutamine-hydrolysing)
MCGITGYFTTVAGRSDLLAFDLKAATESLYHRGPDGSGQWLSEDGRVGFGHRRLAIIDLSDHAAQPMRSRCGGWLMVFNGEVYNFRELRVELVMLGHAFEGSGDTEVILAAFSQWGVDACQRFNGMFAIALWQFAFQRLHLLRDRMGVKPLFYFDDGQTLLFGSEIRALRAYTGWTAEIDRDALLDYLRYRYIADPRSILRQVHKLPPGHRLTIEADGRRSLVRYWSIEAAIGLRSERSEDDLADELEALLVSAFSYRMIADVPVGVFLSCGLDSSLIATLLQKNFPGGVRTFTIGFDDPDYDESAPAAAIAAHLGTEHHSRVLRIDDGSLLLSRWGEMFDEPFADGSGVPTYLVCQMASEQVKVVLSGDGGDELFAGYDAYTKFPAQWRRLRQLPQAARSVLARVGRSAGTESLDDRLAACDLTATARYGRKLSRPAAVAFNRIDANGVGDLYDRALSYFSPRQLDALIGHSTPTRLNADHLPGNEAERLCLWDLNNFLPGDVLAKVDRTSMTVSIEAREPMLDHRLAEFAVSLPYSMRHGALGSKHLLRKILYRHLPRSLVDRPKKGFGAPITKWIAGELRGLVQLHLNPDRIRAQGIFDPAAVAALLNRLWRGDVNARTQVWILLAFGLWHERWVEPVVTTV